jgi:hypothetical protein
MPVVEIRFNTKFTEGKSKYEWRLLIDEQEHLVNEIILNCNCKTSSRFIEGEGLKYHISAFCKTAQIEYEDGIKYAYIE